MGNKSASELLHGLLMKEDVGFKFTKHTIEDMTAKAGMEMTQGEITGFIHRALRLDRVHVVGKTMGKEGRMLYQYEIIDREPWTFKTKGHGSDKGRTIANRHYKPVPDVEPEMKTTPLAQSLLSDRMFNLAVEIAELEKKSLKDYSTDEIIAELKRRVKE